MTSLPIAARNRSFVMGLAGAVVALLLAAAAQFGQGVLFAGLLVAQLAFGLAWLAVTEATGAVGASVVIGLAAVSADVIAVREDDRSLSAAVAVVALAVLVTLPLQLLRQHRSRVTESIAATASAVVLVTLAAHLLALAGSRGGRIAVTAALMSAATALLLGRLADTLVDRPRLAVGSTRGWLGLLLGVVGGGGFGAAVGAAREPLSLGMGLTLGVAAALAASAADLAVDLLTADVADLFDDRRLSATPALAALLPVVFAAPTAYAVIRLLIG